jgi:hypothetical protein
MAHGFLLAFSTYMNVHKQIGIKSLTNIYIYIIFPHACIFTCVGSLLETQTNLNLNSRKKGFQIRIKKQKWGGERRWTETYEPSPVTASQDAPGATC